MGTGSPVKTTELNQSSSLFPASALKIGEFSSGTGAKCCMCFAFLLHKAARQLRAGFDSDRLCEPGFSKDRLELLN